MTAPAAYIDPADQRDLARLLRAMEPKAVARVMQRAGSSAGRKTRTRIVRRVAALTTLKQKDIRVRTRVERRPKGATAVVVAGPPTPLWKFKWGEKGPRNPWGFRPVWAQIWRQKPRETLSYAWPLYVASGRYILVERKVLRGGKRAGRKPLKPLFGPSVPAVLAHTGHELAEVTTDGSAVFTQEIDRQIELVFRRL